MVPDSPDSVKVLPAYHPLPVLEPPVSAAGYDKMPPAHFQSEAIKKCPLTTAEIPFPFSFSDTSGRNYCARLYGTAHNDISFHPLLHKIPFPSTSCSRYASLPGSKSAYPRTEKELMQSGKPKVAIIQYLLAANDSLLRIPEWINPPLRIHFFDISYSPADAV